MRKLLFSVTLDDCEIQTFCTGGKGGQNQNRKEKGVRIIHRDSGARGEGREYREQLQNKRAAFMRMVATKEFKAWHAAEVHRRMNIETTIEQSVDEQMQPYHLRVETRGPLGWEPA